MTDAQFAVLLTRRVARLKTGDACPSLCTQRSVALTLQALGEFLVEGPGEYPERKDLIAMLCTGRPHEPYSQGNWWNDMPLDSTGLATTDLAAMVKEIETCD